jgi:aminoglycoside phosphotransferase (APT) family kinase protein
LGGAAAAAVVVPLHVGLCGGISFAITPYMRPVAGRGIRARWHRFRLRQKILSWLREVTQDTARAPEAEAVSTDFSDPLHHLAESDFLPDKVRSHARSALSDLESGRWKPVHVAAHNDLWAGNMLIAPDNATGPGFGVIDWGAARSEGHAVYDLVRVAMSLNITRTQFVKELAAHAKILDCDIAQMQHHLVSALAYLGDHRGEWPAERFAEMAKACVDYLESASSAAVHH